MIVWNLIQEFNMILIIIDEFNPLDTLLTHRKFHHESIHNTAKNGDEIKGIPRVLKVALKAGKVKKRKQFISQHANITTSKERAENKEKINLYQDYKIKVS